MPTYDYRCNNCGHEFELFQSMKDSPKRKCTECGKNTLERLIGTGAGILFKGSGFYETDYRSPSYKKDAAGDAPPDSGDAKKKNDSADSSSGATKKPCGPSCGCAPKKAPSAKPPQATE